MMALRQYAEERTGKNCRGFGVRPPVTSPRFAGRGVHRGFPVIPGESGAHKFFPRSPKGIDRISGESMKYDE
jgi:hypothetical protein